VSDTRAPQQPASDRQYADRDPMALDKAGGFYIRHVSAMTREGLHSKADIAAELGWRDMLIASLEEQNAALAAPAAQQFASDLLAIVNGPWSASQKLDKLRAALAAPAAQQPAGEPCRDCNGSGERMQSTWGHGPDDYEYPVDCKTCDGTGEAPAAENKDKKERSGQ
jgi:hypothetical protein